MATNINNHAPSFNLIAKIIDDAVYDFNHGDATDKLAAAAFFRDEHNEWMWRAGNATVQDVIKHRLNDDPFAINFSTNKPKKSYFHGEIIEWQGDYLTIAEHAEKHGIEKATLRDRINKYGLCEEVFYSTHLSKKMMTDLGYCK